MMGCMPAKQRVETVQSLHGKCSVRCCDAYECKKLSGILLNAVGAYRSEFTHVESFKMTRNKGNTFAFERVNESILAA